MSETKKTLTFASVALALAVIALVTSPRRVTPDAFLDRGDPFFPDFENPNEAASLEVVEFDEQTAEARAFKVANQSGRWTIPSHHDYPADGKDRLAKTAAGVIGITKDDFRTDNVAEHEACGVVDPLDEAAAALKGRGKRVTMRGPGGQVLADFIVGRELEDRPGYRFVRIPDQKRVYVAKMDIDISTRFEDWIEKDLLEVSRPSIDQVILKDYSIDETTRRVQERDVVTLTKKDDTWEADRMRGDQEVDSVKMNELLSALDSLEIVGVRPKPEGLSAGLESVAEGNGLRISQSALLSLQGKGYYLTRDGRLLSNEGELQARTTDGIQYTLRFGEVVYGQGEAVTAGGEIADDPGGGPGENRYLFITADFLSDMFPEPDPPADTSFRDKAEADWTDQDRRNKELFDAHETWTQTVDRARDLAGRLNRRFADWYYVIPATAFDKVHLTRADLVKKKEAQAAS